MTVCRHVRIDRYAHTFGTWLRFGRWLVDDSGTADRRENDAEVLNTTQASSKALKSKVVAIRDGCNRVK